MAEADNSSHADVDTIGVQVQLESVSFTLDGRYVLSTKGLITRSRLAEGRMLIDGMLAEKIPGPNSPIIAQDREHVIIAAPAGGRLFRLDDLSKPVAIIPVEQYRPVVMDPPRKRIITIRAGVLIVYDYEGGKHGEYKIPYDGNPKRLRHQGPAVATRSDQRPFGDIGLRREDIPGDSAGMKDP